MKNPVTIARNRADDTSTKRWNVFVLPDDEDGHSIAPYLQYLKGKPTFISVNFNPLFYKYVKMRVAI